MSENGKPPHDNRRLGIDRRNKHLGTIRLLLLVFWRFPISILKWSFITLLLLAALNLMLPSLVDKGVLLLSRLTSDAIYALDSHTGWLSKEFGLRPIEPDYLRNFAFIQSSHIVDTDGNDLGCFAKEYRTLVPVTEVNPLFVKAILASEDQWFYGHKGFDLSAIARALIGNAEHLKVKSGASTLTMQIAKNVYLSPERKWRRKISEAVYASAIEHKITKQDILYLYLNLTYFGGGYGVEAASHAYFGKSSKNVTLAEGAFLAGLINQPNVFNYNGEKGRAIAMARKSRVLNLMHEHGFITDKQFDEAVVEKIDPHRFVGACKRDAPYITAQVNREFGVKKKMRIAETGVRFETTIRTPMQRALSIECENTLTQYVKRHPENKDTIQCSSIAVEISTGNVVAMVGGQNFAVNQYDGVTQSLRQPGSAFKPFLYATLLEKHYEAERQKRLSLCASQSLDLAACSSLVGSPTEIIKDCTVLDEPVSVPQVVGSKGQVVSRHFIHNYPYDDPIRHPPYLGMTSCARAIAESRNAATVWAEGQLDQNAPSEALRWENGAKSVIKIAHRLGIESELKPYPVVPLGFNEVTLWEMARAFLPFVNGGCKSDLSFIKRALTVGGKVVYERMQHAECDRVLDVTVANAMLTLLRGVVDSDVGTAHSLRRTFPKGELAGKTGTATNEDGTSSTDNWFIGMTPRYLVATRVNNINKTPLGKKETGGRNALPVFAEFIHTLNLLDPNETFVKIVAVPGGLEPRGEVPASDVDDEADEGVPIMDTKPESGIKKE